jgi:hypothetical protein
LFFINIFSSRTYRTWWRTIIIWISSIWTFRRSPVP